MTKRWVLAGLISTLALGAAVAAPARDPIKAAVASPARADDKVGDARRHAPELLAFSQVKPGDRVLELIPGNGYFTRLFSLVVGPRGKVYALWPTEYANEAVSNVEDMKKMGRKKPFTNVVTMGPQAAKDFAAPEPLDLVFTSQNFHDYPDAFMGKVPPAVFVAAVYKALKPGGTFIVIDHSAKAGSGLAATDTLHRIDEEAVKRVVTAGGFKLDGELGVLRNPADDRTLKVFDPKVRGHTDQFVLRFRKPG